MASRKKHRQGRRRPSGQVVVARQALLRDAAGNVRLRLGCAEDGGSYLLMLGADGKPRVALAACGGAGQAQLLDGRGRPRVVLKNGPGDVCAVTLLDGRGELGAGPHGCAGAPGVLALTGATGRKGAGLWVSPAGVPAEFGHDELHGHPVARAASTHQEEGHRGQPGQNWRPAGQLGRAGSRTTR
jgi:hypothetical protein